MALRKRAAGSVTPKNAEKRATGLVGAENSPVASGSAWLDLHDLLSSAGDDAEVRRIHALMDTITAHERHTHTRLDSSYTGELIYALDCQRTAGCLESLQNKARLGGWL